MTGEHVTRRVLVSASLAVALILGGSAGAYAYDQLAYRYDHSPTIAAAASESVHELTPRPTTPASGAFRLNHDSPPSSVATRATGAAEAVGQARFAPGTWLRHFEKHGASNCRGGNCLGYANSVDYLRGAQNLTRGGSGIETFVRKSGDTLFYRSSTNEFAVLSRDNILRTYFKPDDGYAYWLQQIGGG